MMKKVYLFLFILFIGLGSTNCKKETVCGTLEVVNFLSDLAIDVFSIFGNNTVVDKAIGTTVEIVNIIFGDNCNDTQNSSGISYGEYQTFYRETPNDNWELVGTSSEFEIIGLAPGDSHEISRDVIFTQVGQYYLNARVDIGNDVEEEDESNNEAEGDKEVTTRASLDTNDNSERYIINVVADENTDFELMEKRKQQNIYVLFN